jgi:hypothetical protein
MSAAALKRSSSSTAVACPWQRSPASSGSRVLPCATGCAGAWEAPETIYVSRKADVALLDTFIGPKR